MLINQNLYAILSSYLNRKDDKQMRKYKIEFYVNGIRTEKIVTANDPYNAKKLIEAEYPNCKIQFLNWTEVR